MKNIYFEHNSIFYKKIIKTLNIKNIRKQGIYVDCTFGLSAVIV